MEYFSNEEIIIGSIQTPKINLNNIATLLCEISEEIVNEKSLFKFKEGLDFVEKNMMENHIINIHFPNIYALIKEILENFQKDIEANDINFSSLTILLKIIKDGRLNLIAKDDNNLLNLLEYLKEDLESKIENKKEVFSSKIIDRKKRIHKKKQAKKDSNIKDELKRMKLSEGSLKEKQEDSILINDIFIE